MPIKRLLLLAFTAMLTMLGLGILFPAGPILTRELGFTETQWGVLMSIYPILGVLTGFLWGRFSQWKGRKPAILIGLFGFGIGSALFAMGDTFSELIIARVVGGAFAAATIPAIFAYVADVTPPEKRSVGMGMVGAAIGLGIVLGPALCAIFTPDDATLTQLRRPYWVSAGLAAANLLFVLVRLPESWDEETRAAARSRQQHADLASGWARYTPFLVFSMLIQTAFMGLESTLTFLVADRFDGGPRSSGMVLGLVGLVAVLVQGGLIRRLTLKYSDHRLLTTGTALMALGLVAVGLPLGFGGLLFAGTILAAGHALATPTFIALLSRSTENQGEAQGLNHSAQSWGRVIGPILMTFLYQTFSAVVTYAAGGALTLLAMFVAAFHLKPAVEIQGSEPFDSTKRNEPTLEGR
ncbi:MAG: MFS transporter [Planctomycetota bacterium]